VTMSDGFQVGGVADLAALTRRNNNVSMSGGGSISGL
jgi:hypothetical protein